MDNPNRKEKCKNVYHKRKQTLKFKKSVFFYNALLVCLGSDISSNGPKRTQTTLFQDKYISDTSAIFINGKMKWLSQNFSKSLNYSAAILDSNGNGYYIPETSSANVVINRQTSMRENGKIASSGRYAVVWLDHGVNPASTGYEYAILVASDVRSIENLRISQTSDSPAYEVLQKNPAAHVVRFAGKTSTSSGYVIFDEKFRLVEGPLESVTEDCMVMAEIDSPNISNINLSISSPDLNYNTTKVLNTSLDNGVNENFYMRSQPVRLSVFLSKKVSLLVHRVLINGKAANESLYDHHVVVNPDDPEHPAQGGKEIFFPYLKNGESVEVYTTYVLDNVVV